MPTAEARLRQFYTRFGEHRFADIAEFLSSDVWYIQLNSMTAGNSPRGPQAAGEAYANWGRWFQNFVITEIDVTAQNETEIRKVGGAVACFTVIYGLSGRYATPIPGLRGMRLPVIGSWVDLAMTDKVWMNSLQRINRVTNAIRQI